MTTLTIPEGLKPVAVWDCNDKSSTWWSHGLPERIRWAKANIHDVNDTLRLDFYLLDAPFAVAHRVARNERGKLYVDPATLDVATKPPVIVPLAELPPDHLLKG